VALVFEEPHSFAAMKAREAAKRYVAWDWIQIEAHAALTRRSAKPDQIRSLQTLLDNFQYIAADSEDYPSIVKILEKHRLRAADAGHLFCLKQAKKLVPEVAFVCFDEELVRAAEREGVKVFGRSV
jgi:hypothetical protein